MNGVHSSRLWEAYVAGFMASAEGMNGEYPFAQPSEEWLAETLSEPFAKWLASRADASLSAPPGGSSDG